MYKSFNYSNDRFIPFAGPFILGALTGGVGALALNPRPRPVYPVYNYPYYY